MAQLPNFSQFFKDFKQRSFKDFVRQYFLNSTESNFQLTLAVMLGLFFSVAPIWGYQTVAALALAYYFKLNKVVTVVASQVSMGPMIPVAIFLSFKFGGWILGSSAEMAISVTEMNMVFMKLHLFQYIIGSLCLAVMLTLVGGTVTYGLLKVFRKTSA